MEVDALLKSHPELADEVNRLISKRLSGRGAKYSDQAKGYPKFVFTADSHDRQPGSLCRVTNTFGHEAGGLIRFGVGDEAYLVVVDENREIIVHEPYLAWEGG